MMKTVRDGDRKFRRMKEGERIYEFNCGNNYEDLNDFIINDAPLYRDELLAVTYVIEDSEKTLAYCSLANDRIGIEDFPSNTDYNRFRKKRFVNAKRIKHYPAIKICRLGVDVEHQSNLLKHDGCICDFFRKMPVILTTPENLADFFLTFRKFFDCND